MSRFLYWTIVLGTEPTSFRASEADELLPTLTQLRRKHPDATLRWFQRGRLWISPDDAKAALSRERSDAQGTAGHLAARRQARRSAAEVHRRQEGEVDQVQERDSRARRIAARRARRSRTTGRAPTRPPVDRPRDERPPIKPDAGAPPADRPPRRDWRTQTEPAMRRG